LLAGIGGAYLLASVVVSAQVAGRARDARYLFIMPMVFAGVHLSYGLGSLWGLFNVTAFKVSRFFKRSEVT
jgi:hypothetical protein